MPHDETLPARNYCYFLDHRKYNRNRGCQLHDNAYGIAGGGRESFRRASDTVLYRTMRDQGDPMALIALLACRGFGWFFFNYHSGRWLWRGQLLRRFVKDRS
ncbi:hypothetical protein SPHN_06190 [Sphingomonas faeni]|nr:hypothetical protein [Sphingomonas faeni]